jgi:threonine/homoserine efflux transporter RhtA
VGFSVQLRRTARKFDWWSLASHGLVLARGERRDFVVVDPVGGLHALSKRITSATAAQMRARLADLDPATLPRISKSGEYGAGEEPGA